LPSGRDISRGVRLRSAVAVAITLPLAWSLRATAQSEPGSVAPAPAVSVSASASTSTSASATPPPATKPAEAPPGDPERKSTLEPKTATASPTVIRFVADPLSDSAVLAISAGWVALSQSIISSGELRPQQPVSDAKLTAMDRWATKQDFDENAPMRSNIVLWSAAAFAVVDPIWNGVAHDNAQVFLVDAFLYAESAAITGALTNLAKIAVRRPRPRAYQEQQKLIDEAKAAGKEPEDITDTDQALSFVSGHASTVATISATAAYLSWARAPRGSWKPWVTTAVGFVATAWVSVERVLAGAHFPSDVLAGAMIGYGVGILVPHIHREQTAKQRAVWLGYSPYRGGGVASVTLTF
jgi:membrane-associated phospholipid phosphatase